MQRVAFRGAWVKTDSLVAFKMNPPTILEQIRFHHRENRLEADTLLGKTRFQIVLRSHEPAHLAPSDSR
jgi:hypothetical protein